MMEIEVYNEGKDYTYIFFNLDMECETGDSEVFFFYLLIFLERRGRERETKRETLICWSSYLCIHWLILVYALTRDRTCNLGILR